MMQVSFQKDAQGQSEFTCVIKGSNYNTSLEGRLELQL